MVMASQKRVSQRATRLSRTQALLSASYPKVGCVDTEPGKQRREVAAESGFRTHHPLSPKSSALTISRLACTLSSASLLHLVSGEMYSAVEWTPTKPLLPVVFTKRRKCTLGFCIMKRLTVCLCGQLSVPHVWT